MTDLTDPVQVDSLWDYFRTEQGKTIRVEQDGDGALRVDMLKDGTWSEAPRGMIGLRLSDSTRRLSPKEILALPFARIRVRDIELGRAT